MTDITSKNSTKARPVIALGNNNQSTAGNARVILARCDDAILRSAFCTVSNSPTPHLGLSSEDAAVLFTDWKLRIIIKCERAPLAVRKSIVWSGRDPRGIIVHCKQSD